MSTVKVGLNRTPPLISNMRPFVRVARRDHALLVQWRHKLGGRSMIVNDG